jgi:UDP-GlcNAc:undecaprenyl-phosphate GlcNAc-1-phosphate transferase
MPLVVVIGASLALSMAIIPLMLRLAPALGMMDRPQSRKVHAVPVGRVGGYGIVLGALLPIAAVLPLDPLSQSYLLGSLVLFAFGTWDDRKELHHSVKFVGQFVAVGLVVLHGGLVIERLPFLEPNPLPPVLGIPFTFFALVGMINAINHSDGLDGLAGGESVLSLAAIAYLALLSDGFEQAFIAAATAGGIFGFLRYNTHPARVFMGDNGSQFLGFTLGFLVVLVTQDVNTAVSPAIPALILGLPVIDIVAVLYLRVRSRGSWFRATRNHIHHRLLDIGLSHAATVVVIYLIHTSFVVLGIALRYASDWQILTVYFGLIVFVFASLVGAERAAVLPGGSRGVGLLNVVTGRLRSPPSLLLASTALEWAVPFFFLAVSLGVRSVPEGFGVTAGVLGVLAVAALPASGRVAEVVTRFCVFGAAGLVAFLSTYHAPPFLEVAPYARYVVFGGLSLLVMVALKTNELERFRSTPFDYLLGLLVLVVGAIEMNGTSMGLPAWQFVVAAAILLYASEVVLEGERLDPRPLTWGTAASLLITAAWGTLG